MTGNTYGILAGYDGSSDSGQALRWAAREARARGTTVTVCLAWAPTHIALPRESAMYDLARLQGKEILALGLPYAEPALGPGHVATELADGPAARVLCERSRSAEMVVVGSRGNTELPGLLLGSVAWQVAGHATGRVVVVRGQWRPVNHAPGPVVAGVDGSLASLAALAFAFEEAALRDVPLVAVCALADAAGRLGEAHLIKAGFGRALAGLEEELPEVTVVRKVVAGAPRTALLTAADGAQMLVLGCRGRGGLDNMALGSVAQAMLHHAACPVGIAHPAS
jgi:nucleotide-binding universal stress UspA family protein